MCDPPSRRGTAAVVRACAAVDRYDALTARSGVGARGPIRLRPGDLVLMDEASMVATPDLADVITQAAAAGAKVVRFRAAWEQAASLRLRAGDTAMLAEYDQHGRVYGGDPEQMMAADHALRPGLSRRARGKHRRRRRGQSGGPDHLHPQRPRCPGGGARPDPGQRQPSPHRRHHPQGAGRAPRAGC